MVQISILQHGRRDLTVNLILCIINTFYHDRNNFLVYQLVLLWSKNAYVLFGKNIAFV